MFYKKICTFIISIVCLILVMGASVYANDEIPYCCNTSPELLEELHTELLQKKRKELNDKSNCWSYNLAITPFSLIENTNNLTPSTGDVRILVLPIEFTDATLTKAQLNSIYPNFFQKNDTENNINKLSVAEAYERLSYGKLNMSGDVLPVYTASGTKNDYSDMSIWNNLIEEAITSYTDIDFSNYDGNDDGYIDIFCIEYATKTSSSGGSAWGNYVVRMDIDLPNGIKIGKRAQIAMSNSTDPNSYKYNSSSEVHEIGHLLGLPDNYLAYGSECPIDENLNDIMGKGWTYFNVYYKYLLEWLTEEDDSALVLTYDDISDENNLQDISLSSVEDIYNEHRPKALFFIPQKASFPFDEFYAVEYRTGNVGGYFENKGGNPEDYNGIVIWHLDTNTTISGSYKNTNGFIQSVYKNGGEKKTDNTSTTALRYVIPNDMYLKNDTWSSTTSPSSDFYSGFKTGAYLEVLDMDEEKATVRVGFQDMNWEQPTVSVTGGYNESINSFTGQEEKYVYFSLSYDDVYTIMGNKPLTNKDDVERLSKEVIDKYVEVSSEDIPVQINYDRCTLNGNNQVYIRIDGIDAAENEGAVVQLHLKEGSAINGFKKCEAVTYEVQVPDITPPTGTITYSTDENTGMVTAALTVSEDIQPIEMTHTFYRNGSYTFEFYDLAGNKGTATATVDWIERAPVTAEVEYSTTELTNQDVVVKIIPSEKVQEKEEELTHTFTENGSYTFTYHDLYGNAFEKTVTVDWIDKRPPSCTIYYSTSSDSKAARLKGPVMAVVTTRNDVKPFETLYKFEENGSRTFQIESLAGNIAEKTITVNWIDNDNPLGEIRYSTTDWTIRT